MGTRTILQLPQATALNGAEQVETVQNNTSVRTSLSVIAATLGLPGPQGAPGPQGPPGIPLPGTAFVPASAGAAGIQAAYNSFIGTSGGIIYLGPGTFFVGSVAINPVALVTLQGAGMGVSIIQQTAAGVRAFDLPGANNGAYMAFIDFTVNGTWQSNQSLGGDGDRCFAIGGITRLLFQNIECTNSRQMSLTAGFGQEVTVTGCRIQNSARDCINLSSTQRCIVVNNVIRQANDDSVAIHQEAVDGNPPHEGHIVANNHIEDAPGIKLLGATKCVIANNTLRRVKAYGIYTDPGGVEGYSDQISVNIIGNVITDIISPNFYVPGGGGSVIAIGIFIGNAAKSFQKPVVGGVPPDINLPENLYYLSNTATAQNAGGQGYNIVGNTIYGFTLPATTYATWGFGQMFYSTGFVNPDLSAGWKYSAQGIRFTGAILQANIQGNNFCGLSTCIGVDTGIAILDQLNISGNVIRRFSQSGISVETSTLRQGRILIENNTFDADPYFENANRTTPLDGTWNGGFLPCAIDIVAFNGYIVRGNNFRNLLGVHHFGSTGNVSYEGNTYYMLPASGMSLINGNNSGNKGIRIPNGLGSSTDIVVVEDSDPTSSTYGTELGRTSLTAGAMPTSGYWITGMFVKNIATVQSGTAGAEYTVVGWSRLTTGTTNVLNTDWREMRCLTGN